MNKRMGWFVVRTDMADQPRAEISLPFRMEDLNAENAWGGIDEWNLPRVAIITRELRPDEEYFTLPVRRRA